MLIKTLLSTFLLISVIGVNISIGEASMIQTRENQANEITLKLYDNKNLSQLTEDAELQSIMKKFIYNDISQQVNMSLMQKELLTLVILTANSSTSALPLHIKGALRSGASPEQIRETIIQCTPYIGLPKVAESLTVMTQVFKKEKIQLPISTAATVNDENRYQKGLATQKEIFGSAIDKMNESTPEDLKHINYYLSSNCFGDYYTRQILNLKERELITFTALITLGYCDPQVRAHINGNLSVGNTRQDLLDAVTIALPYIGYPRTLNAIAAINSIIVPSKK